MLGKGGSWEVAIFSSYFIIALRRAVSCLLHDNDLELEHHAATSGSFSSTRPHPLKQSEGCKDMALFLSLSLLRFVFCFFSRFLYSTCSQSWAFSVFDRGMSLDTKHNIYRHRSFHSVSSKVVITA